MPLPYRLVSPRVSTTCSVLVMPGERSRRARWSLSASSPPRGADDVLDLRSGEVAGGALARLAVGLHGRLLVGADPGRLRDRAARVEAAARGRVDRRGDLPLQRDRLPVALHARVWHRDGAEQRAGVGVLRAV